MAVPVAATTPAEDKAAILQVIGDMQAAWNRGDFPGYMAGFANPQIVFVSGGRIQDGWQGTLDHYVRDYGGAPERRGTVRFYDMTVDLLGPDAALLISHYHLERPEHPQEGINTRLFRRIDGRWRITMNHVSSYERHDAPPR
ncbi:nuclear transport factor 2 family protein [uncultured Sphingomonas sp.]|uniref:YybH family protein n=1 Tax=uncultured Sphingomonas sp. TaxID=158754 RepID=UPI0025CD6707|nr:nuclear transport factor 2 family protein [uncultured Sphingomonas sp.]